MSEKLPEATASDEPVNAARRRLLRVGVYAAPVVLGSLMARSVSAQDDPCDPDLPKACSCVPSGVGTPSCK